MLQIIKIQAPDATTIKNFKSKTVLRKNRRYGVTRFLVCYYLRLRRRRFGWRVDARAALGVLPKCSFKRSTSISRLPSISRFASRSCSRRDVTSKWSTVSIWLLFFLFLLLLVVDDDDDTAAVPTGGGSFLVTVQNLSSSMRRQLDSAIFCQLSSSDSITEFASDLYSFIDASFNNAHEWESPRIIQCAALDAFINLSVMVDSA